MDDRNLGVDNNTAELDNKKTTQRTMYTCDICRYSSPRKYNVERHKTRIHSILKKKLICCGKSILTKGDFYLHSLIVHPKKKFKAIISKEKYKILTNNQNNQKNIINKKEEEKITDIKIFLDLSPEEIKEENEKLLDFLNDIDFDSVPRA